METKNSAGKVGFFVLVGLVIIAALILNFSKGASLFASGYGITVKTKNVGSLRPDAAVVMSGVPIGSVKTVSLSDDGRIVLIKCRIQSRYVIHRDAIIEIEQSGFLGDQYVGIVPAENKGEVLADGAEIDAREPFNLQEAARSAVALMQRLEAVSDKLNTAVARVDRTLLSETTLGDITNAIASFRRSSDRAETAIVHIEAAVTNATPEFAVAMTNLVLFSQNVNTVATEAKTILLSNEDNIHGTLVNLKTTSDNARSLVDELQKGKGTAGALLKDEALRLEMTGIVHDFGILASNLSRHGILWKPREMRPLTNALHKGRGDLWN